LYCFQFSKKIV